MSTEMYNVTKFGGEGRDDQTITGAWCFYKKKGGALEFLLGLGPDYPTLAEIYGYFGPHAEWQRERWVQVVIGDAFYVIENTVVPLDLADILGWGRRGSSKRNPPDYKAISKKLVGKKKQFLLNEPADLVQVLFTCIAGQGFGDDDEEIHGEIRAEFEALAAAPLWRQAKHSVVNSLGCSKYDAPRSVIDKWASQSGWRMIAVADEWTLHRTFTSADGEYVYRAHYDDSRQDFDVWFWAKLEL